ncbi:MAG TPA: hypothetical protein VIF43_01855 [Patescibacteria group bacterium]
MKNGDKPTEPNQQQPQSGKEHELRPHAIKFTRCHATKLRPCGSTYPLETSGWLEVSTEYRCPDHAKPCVYAIGPYYTMSTAERHRFDRNPCAVVANAARVGFERNGFTVRIPKCVNARGHAFMNATNGLTRSQEPAPTPWAVPAPPPLRIEPGYRFGPLTVVRRCKPHPDSKLCLVLRIVEPVASAKELSNFDRNPCNVVFEHVGGACRSYERLAVLNM